MMNATMIYKNGNATETMNFIEGYKAAANMKKENGFRLEKFEYFPGVPESFKLAGTFKGIRVEFIGKA